MQAGEHVASSLRMRGLTRVSHPNNLLDWIGTVDHCSLSLAEAITRNRIIGLVLDAVPSQHTKRAYERGLGDFFEWYGCSGQTIFNKAVVQQYRSVLEARGLAPQTINTRLSAIRKLAAEAADNGLLAPELAAGIARVRGVKVSGVRVGNWLTSEEAEKLCRQPAPSTRKGKRDRVLLVLLIGCGLRRAEVAQLSVEQIQQRDGRWVIADLVGKGRRIRSVPMPNWAKPLVDAWTDAAGINTGRLLRPVNKADDVHGDGISPQAIYAIVRGYGIGLKLTIAPHDLRRTFAKITHRRHAPIEQIQLSLGHASIVTTERYLGVRQDFADAPCDRIGFSIPLP